MIDLEFIKEIAQVGAIPMLTVAVIVLWRRLEALQREFIDYLKSSAAQGDEAAQVSIDKRNGNA